MKNVLITLLLVLCSSAARAEVATIKETCADITRIFLTESDDLTEVQRNSLREKNKKRWEAEFKGKQFRWVLPVDDVSKMLWKYSVDAKCGPDKMTSLTLAFPSSKSEQLQAVQQDKKYALTGILNSYRVDSQTIEAEGVDVVAASEGKIGSKPTRQSAFDEAVCEAACAQGKGHLEAYKACHCK